MRSIRENPPKRWVLNFTKNHQKQAFLTLKSYVFLWRTDYILMFATDAQKILTMLYLMVS